jgi:hypothetical protein
MNLTLLRSEVMQSASRDLFEINGRYKWSVLLGSGARAPSIHRDSAVSFASRDEAEEDLGAFLRLEHLGNGTFVRSKEDIDELLAAAVRGREGCDGFWFSKVQWQEPDDVGCNWFFSDFRYDVVGCVGRIVSEIDSLRRIPWPPWVPRQ